MTTFDFEPAPFVPFRDKKILEQARSITRDQLAEHSNPELNIRIVRDSSVEFIQFTDIIATQGTKIAIDFRINNHLIGSDIQTENPTQMIARVQAPEPIEFVEIIRDGNEVVHR